MKFIKLSIFTIALASMAFVACSKKTTSTQSTDNSTVTQRSTTSDVPQRGQRGGRRGAPQFSSLLERMDSNKDGKISTSEVDGRMKERFSTMDTDNDGFITEEEFKNAPRPERGQRGSRGQRN